MFSSTLQSWQVSGDTNEDGEIRSVFQFNFSGQSSEYSSLKIRKHICLEMNTHHHHFSTLFLLTMIHDTEECGQLIETTSSQLSTRLSAESSWVTEQDQRFGWKTSTDLRLLNPKLRENENDLQHLANNFTGNAPIHLNVDHKTLQALSLFTGTLYNLDKDEIRLDLG